MGISLGALFQVSMLLLNALCILNEPRFLVKGEQTTPSERAQRAPD